MTLKKLELSGFKSFGRKETLFFDAPIVAIVGPNGSGKSNVAEAFKWVLGEQSLKSLRGKRGEDLIFNGSSALGRLSRASVIITFDNADRRFSSIDFDEAIISREVFRDGTNEYKINGSVVRLRDIVELLANVSLGSSGHHIISQGEADRVLNANQVERRLMIEDALGLKIYQWKLAESEKKLAKTEDNIKQVESIRREIAPHLKFLKKQLEKIEKVREYKNELRLLYRDYLKREELYLEAAKEKLNRELSVGRESLARISRELSVEEPVKERQDNIIEAENRLRETESRVRLLRSQKDELARALGRIEGLLEIREKETKKLAPGVKIPLADAEQWANQIDNELVKLEQATDLAEIKKTIKDLRFSLKDFLVNYEKKAEAGREPQAEILGLQSEHEKMKIKLDELDQEETNLQTEITQEQELIAHRRQTIQNAEHNFYELKAEKSKLEAHLESLDSRRETLAMEENNFKRELGEGNVLLGRELLDYQDQPVDWSEVENEDRNKQEERRRKIERIKIRLEDMGVESTEVLREHDEVAARDEFLGHELEDLAKSRESLLAVMDDLRAKIDTEFTSGLTKINQEFQRFFTVLFGGGVASLEIVKPSKKTVSFDLSLVQKEEMTTEENDEEKEVGIEVNVSLPRKKIRGLAMLSGGERALTSIALLFAMSQVNPPPFLILDETDAALDEANSKKYSDMIENLSKYSQLILITHNRETMSRASILYGVTMGADSVSRLISIKLDEAAQYAK